MSDMNCKNCKHFKQNDEKERGFTVGYCWIEPFDVGSLVNNHSMAVECGHSGRVTVGEMFGCVNFTRG